MRCGGNKSILADQGEYVRSQIGVSSGLLSLRRKTTGLLLYSDVMCEHLKDAPCRQPCSIPIDTSRYSSSSCKGLNRASPSCSPSPLPSFITRPPRRLLTKAPPPPSLVNVKDDLVQTWPPHRLAMQEWKAWRPHRLAMQEWKEIEIHSSRSQSQKK